MAKYRIALLVKDSSSDRFIVARQSRPPEILLEEEENGHHYVDSDLWDLPSSTLLAKCQQKNSESEASFDVIFQEVNNVMENLGLRGFDIAYSVQQILRQISAGRNMIQPWSYRNLVEEADFGPGLPIHTLYFTSEAKSDYIDLTEESKWLAFSEASRSLVHVNPRDDRIGHLASIASHLGEPLQMKFNIKLQCQEYPPGVLVVPMNSNTARPFKKTNLVVFAPGGHSDTISDDSKFTAYGDALIMDPGCHFRVHDQLAEIVASLPRKLVIFVTHHHHDHVDGLTTIQRCNPNATLFAHEATIKRIGKGGSPLVIVMQSHGQLCNFIWMVGTNSDSLIGMDAASLATSNH